MKDKTRKIINYCINYAIGFGVSYGTAYLADPQSETKLQLAMILGNILPLWRLRLRGNWVYDEFYELEKSLDPKLRENDEQEIDKIKELENRLRDKNVNY